MSPLVTDELNIRLKKMGIRRIIKKPVDPRLLRKVIREISFPDEVKTPSFGKKGEGSRFIQKGGEEHEEVDFSFSRNGDGDQYGRYGIGCKAKEAPKPAAKEEETS